jgi:hypothetical protein
MQAWWSQGEQVLHAGLVISGRTGTAYRLGDLRENRYYMQAWWSQGEQVLHTGLVISGRTGTAYRLGDLMSVLVLFFLTKQNLGHSRQSCRFWFPCALFTVPVICVLVWLRTWAWESLADCMFVWHLGNTDRGLGRPVVNKY